jgi:hypothetical protein
MGHKFHHSKQRSLSQDLDGGIAWIMRRQSNKEVRSILEKRINASRAREALG